MRRFCSAAPVCGDFKFFPCPHRNSARSPYHSTPHSPHYTRSLTHTKYLSAARIITPGRLPTPTSTPQSTPRVTTHTRILPGRCQTPLEFRFQAHSGDAQQVISFPGLLFLAPQRRSGVPQLPKHTLPPSLPPIPSLSTQAHTLSAWPSFLNQC